MKSRRGYLLVEAVAAAALLAVFVVAGIELLALSAGQQRALERRAIAQQEAANMLERAAAVRFDDLTSGRLAEWGLSSDLKQTLPGGKARVVARSIAGPPPAAQISVEVNWDSDDGAPQAPVRLSTWVFRPTRSSAP